MTSKYGKNKKSGTQAAGECVTDVLMFLLHSLDFTKNNIVQNKGQYAGVAMVIAVAWKLVK